MWRLQERSPMACVLRAERYSGSLQKSPGHEWDGKNPEIPDRVSEHGYSRATGGIIASKAMQLYSGWSATAGTYGGAIAVTERRKRKTRLAEHPLGRQAISGLATDDHYLFAGTTLAGEGLPVLPDESPNSRYWAWTPCSPTRTTLSRAP